MSYIGCMIDGPFLPCAMLFVLTTMPVKKKLANKIQSVVGISPDLKLVEPRSIERSEGKVKRVLDKRVFKN